LTASASESRIAHLDTYARHLGRAFQVRDDLLDVVADERTFGKIVGGDILAGKRTYLLLKALRRARGLNRSVLVDVLRRNHKRGKQPLIRAVRSVYADLGVTHDARRQIAGETTAALRALRKFPENRGTVMLRWIAGTLENRVF
jgi:geranylgeranyl diphosphate synthase type II